MIEWKETWIGLVIGPALTITFVLIIANNHQTLPNKLFSFKTYVSPFQIWEHFLKFMTKKIKQRTTTPPKNCIIVKKNIEFAFHIITMYLWFLTEVINHRVHSFSAYATFTNNAMCGYQGVRYAISSKHSAYVLNEWSTMYVNIAKPSVCSYCESGMISDFSNSRNICPVVFCKKCILKNSAKLSQKNLCRNLLFNIKSGTLLTRDSGVAAQVFSNQINDFFKIRLFREHFQATASETTFSWSELNDKSWDQFSKNQWSENELNFSVNNQINTCIDKLTFFIIIVQKNLFSIYT